VWVEVKFPEIEEDNDTKVFEASKSSGNEFDFLNESVETFGN
jgi:hypothetical protein